MSNFQKRVLTAVIGGILMIGILIMGREFLLATLCALSYIGYFELTKAVGVHTNDKNVNSLEIVGLITITAWYAVLELSYYKVIETNPLAWGVVVLLLGLVGYMTVYVFSFPKYNASQVMAAVFSMIYCPIMLSFIYLIRHLEYGLYLVWMIFVCSWMCDIFAYLVGIKIGKHRMAPVLSPKKSIEGAVGGVVGSAVIGSLYAIFILTPQITNANSTKLVVLIVIISMIGAFISMVGDLAASAIKRNHDIKDYGKLLPGHGGIMDRFDSVIFVAPLVYILSVVFLLYI